MRLALDVLRSAPRTARGELMPEGAAVVLHEAHGALTFGHDALLPRSVWLVTREGAPPRLLRARLALALRALLRADADELGPVRYDAAPDAEWCCELCGEPVADQDDRCIREDCVDAGVSTGDTILRRLRFVPLWQSAPLTGHGRRPVGLKRRGGA
jgi:hypothetical protein